MTEQEKREDESFEQFVYGQFQRLTELAKIDARIDALTDTQFRNAWNRDVQLFVCILIVAVIAVIGWFR